MDHARVRDALVSGVVHEENDAVYEATYPNGRNVSREYSCGPFKYEAVAKATRATELQRTGFAGLVCTHGVGGPLINLKRGERFHLLAQAMDLRAPLRDTAPRRLLVANDVCCLVERWLRNRKVESPYPRSRFCDVKLCGPVLHSYVHGHKCFMKRSVRSVVGAGLVGPECSERFWAAPKRRLPLSLSGVRAEQRIDIVSFGVLGANAAATARLPANIVSRLGAALDVASASFTATDHVALSRLFGGLDNATLAAVQAEVTRRRLRRVRSKHTTLLSRVASKVGATLREYKGSPASVKALAGEYKHFSDAQKWLRASEEPAICLVELDTALRRLQHGIESYQASGRATGASAARCRYAQVLKVELQRARREVARHVNMPPCDAPAGGA